MTNPPNKDKTCLLKETRQNKGITLEMVHEATKIPLDALKAIEQGYSVHKLQTFYYRGFIKIYAKYLELDETRVLQEYGMQESAAPKPQPSPVKEPKKNTSTALPIGSSLKNAVRPVFKSGLFKSRAGILIAIVVVVLAFFMFGKLRASSSKNKTKVQQSAVKTAVKPSVKPVVKPKAKEPIAKENIVREERKETSAKPVVAAIEEPSNPPKTEQAKPAQINEQQDTKPKSIELTVRATKSGWLQVKADGQIVFQSTLKKGDAESWKAETEIELSGKNVNLLEFELNGKMLGALGASDRGAKKVVFTKDGLSVKK